MKIATLNTLLTFALILGFSQLALSNSSSLKIAEQVILNDSLKQSKSSLHPSVYQTKSDETRQNSVFDTFVKNDATEVLKITLTTDLLNLTVDKTTKDYQPAFLKIENKDGSFSQHTLKLKPRGKFRRKVCDFPPLKLNFSKSALESQGLNPEFDKLKLVTHCTSGKIEAKDNVLREYLTYKMYNELTDNSFRVQLVKIKYVDLHNGVRPIVRYGFIIENTDEMATRLNGKVCDCHGLTKEMMAVAPHNLTAMFQFMIGNEDWNAQMLRNIKAVKTYTGGHGDNVLVPYDFDFSGVVDAGYAIPDPDLHHQFVKQRHFFGAFSSEDNFQKMAGHFKSRKDNILKVVKKFKPLGLNSRLEILEYLEEFYQILDDNEQAQTLFLSNS